MSNIIEAICKASKELWELTMLLVGADKESFTGGLEAWYQKWKSFLNERKVEEKGKKIYIDKRLRGGYRSLKNNLPY